jgi:hypothetical protein
MRLINQTKKTVLAEDVYFADTPFRRIKGLLGRKSFNQGQALVIKPCNSIHTFFMRFPIDLLFLDKNNKVVQAIPDVRPFRISSIYFQANYVIELPPGTINATSTSVADILSLVSNLT